MNIKLTLAAVAAVAASAPAMSTELIINGGFETGDFTGWTVTNNGSSGCDTDWNVSTSGTASNCYYASDPTSGSYAAYNSFDGDGPQRFTLSQTFTIGNLASAAVSWIQSWDVTNFSPPNRSFSVDLYDSTGSNILVNLWTESFDSGSSGWASRSVDVTAALAAFSGQTVRLAFSNVIPLYYDGPSAFGFDNASFDVTEAVPEPAMLGLFGIGAIGLGLARRRRG